MKIKSQFSSKRFSRQWTVQKVKPFLTIKLNSPYIEHLLLRFHLKSTAFKTGLFFVAEIIEQNLPEIARVRHLNRFRLVHRKRSEQKSLSNLGHGYNSN